MSPMEVVYRSKEMVRKNFESVTFKDYSPDISLKARIDSENLVYEGVRQVFLDVSYNTDNIGIPYWNPLKWLISPDMTVVLKPNFIRHYNDLAEDLSSRRVTSRGNMICPAKRKTPP